MKKNTNKDKKEDRHLELSGMFLEMGRSLIKEGKENNDYVTSQSGTFFVFMAGIIFSEEDVYNFGQLCSMYSAKKILEGMELAKNPLIENLKKKSKDESYEDFIKRINKLRGDLGHEPIG